MSNKETTETCSTLTRVIYVYMSNSNKRYVEVKDGWTTFGMVQRKGVKFKKL